MRTSKLIPFVLALATLFLFAQCEKDEDDVAGVGGQHHLHGEVEYNEDHAEDADVFIWYGETTVSDVNSGFDDQAVTDHDGKFEFEELTRGDYYIYAKWTDTTGTLRTGDITIEITTKSGETEFHIELQ